MKAGGEMAPWLAWSRSLASGQSLNIRRETRDCSLSRESFTANTPPARYSRRLFARGVRSFNNPTR